MAYGDSRQVAVVVAVAGVRLELLPGVLKLLKFLQVAAHFRGARERDAVVEQDRGGCTAEELST